MKGTFTIHGFHEAVASVSDLDRSIQFFQEVAGWQLKYRGLVAKEFNLLWRLEPDIQADEALLGAPDETTGYLRLIQFHHSEQLQIRSNAQTWDTGGILDFNIRIADMDEAFRQFQTADWQGVGDPVKWQFGPYQVKEWLSRGPDSLCLALIERITPALEGWDLSRSFSRIFNSTQTIRDMDRTLDFYTRVLGFQQVMHHSGSNPEAGPNVLGIPHNLINRTPHDIYILHPQGENIGSIELIDFPELQGHDFSHRASPPNLGALALRFPTEGLDSLRQRFIDEQVPFTETKTSVYFPPYGKAKILAVQAPEGAWLEFFECESLSSTSPNG